MTNATLNAKPYLKKITVAVVVALALLPIARGDITYYVAPPGTGETVYDGSGTEDDPFHHPQMAIDAGVTNRASESELVTVNVKAGSYTFWPAANPKIWDATYYWGNEYYAIHITNSNVHVIGVDGKTSTTIDGGYKNTLPNPGPNVPGKGAPDPTGMRNGHAIQIASGLTNVKVSGFTVQGGYQENCNGTSPTTAVAGSGVIEDCLIKVYYRYQCSFVSLSGTAILRNCEVTSQSGGGASGNVGANQADILMQGNSMVENCYIHDINKSTGSNYGGTYSTYYGVHLKASGCVLRGCLIANIANGHETVSAATGGGICADAGTIDNCTVVGCKAMGYGGGIYVSSSSVKVRNSIFWGNTATANAAGNDIHVASGKTPTIINTTYSAGVNVPENSDNKQSDPKFVGGTGAAAYSIPDNSPCAGAGAVLDWMTADSKDLASNARIWTDGTVSMGAYEAQGRSSVLSGDIVFVGDDFGRAPFTASFKASPEGVKGTCLYQWDFGDGTPISYTSEATPTHTYTAVGRYAVTLTIKDDRNVPALVDKTLYAISVGTTCHVKTNSVGVPPYATWETATSNLQAAVDLKPDLVLVTNGTYTVEYPNETINGLKLDKAVEVRSIEGAAETHLTSGYAKSPGKERHVVTITHADAVLDGFSVERGCQTTLSASAGVVRNCIVSNCLGVINYTSLINGSAVVSNCVFDGGNLSCVLENGNGAGRCVQVAGNAVIDRCDFRQYKLTLDGCNAAKRSVLFVTENATVRNCRIHDNNLAFQLYSSVSFRQTNSAVYVECGFLDNCTIANNTCRDDACGGLCVSSVWDGKKSYYPTIRNCIVSSNTITAAKIPTDFYAYPGFKGVFLNNLVGIGVLPSSATNCLSGVDPMLDAGTYRPQKDSPCIDAGARLEWCSKKGMAIDFGGEERRRGGYPDIGCWELQRDYGMMLLVR